MKGQLLTRLNLGTACAVAVALAMMTMTWWVTQEVEEAARNGKQSAVAAEALHQTSGALWQLRMTVPEYLLAPANQRAHVVRDEEKWHAVLQTNLAAFAGTLHSQAEAEALTELRAQYLRYREARQKFFALHKAGRSEEALAWRDLTVSPYGAETVRALSRLVSLQRAHGEARQNEELEWVHRNRLVVFALSVLLLFLLTLGYVGARHALLRNPGEGGQ